jgi:small nuclear ribonucleoprotein (snRNP)-like protein
VIVKSSRSWPIALLLLAGCSVGSSVKNYAPAKGPAGATVKLELTGNRTLAGELLAVEDSSLLVLSDGQLMRVGLPLIQTGNAAKVGFTGPS